MSLSLFMEDQYEKSLIRLCKCQVEIDLYWLAYIANVNQKYVCNNYRDILWLYSYHLSCIPHVGSINNVPIPPLCLRKDLLVSQQDHLPNQEILRIPRRTGIAVKLNQSQLHQSDHVKQFLYTELALNQETANMHTDESVKSALMVYSILVEEWQTLSRGLESCQTQGH